MSRAAQWRSSWALALRMGRRDAWRAKGRSLLVLVMVAMPVLLLTGGLTLLATRDINPQEELPGRLGSAQALVADVLESAVPQSPDGRSGGCPDTCPAARALPNGATATSPAPLVKAGVEQLLGRGVLPVAQGSADVRVGDRRLAVPELFADAARPAFHGRLDLVSGRWAQGPTELVVTEAGVRHGLPDHGSLQLVEQGPKGRTTTPYTVVGRARAGTGEISEIVRPATLHADYLSWLVEGDAPVTWAQVQQANAYGLTIASREAIEQAPADRPGMRSTGEQSLLVTLMAAGLFIVSALLAGPAFAVIAQRQRHTLAIAASNGATGPQLRRTVLGQALVLGVLSALVASALGIGLAPLGIRLVNHWRPTAQWGPFDIPWRQLLLVLASAIVSSVTAALLPARGLGRLDVVAALRGQMAPRPARRSYPLVGIALVALGVLATWAAFEQPTGGNRPMLLLFGGSLALVAGALLTVPMVLVGIGRLTSRAPAAVRMAARDNARQRGRATPTVAAVMAGSILFSGLAIGLASYDAMAARTYTPTAPDGWLTAQDSRFFGDSPSADAAREIVAKAVPGARTALLSHAELRDPADRTPSTSASLWIAPSDCPVEQPDGPPSARCAGIALGGYGNAHPLVLVDPADLDALPQLDADARAALARGEILSSAPDSTGTLPVRRLVSQDDHPDRPATVSAAGSITVHALARSSLDRLAEYSGEPGLVLATPATARALGAAWTSPYLLLAHGEHPVTTEQEETIAGQLDAMPDLVHVERGYQSPVRAIAWILFATVLALSVVATVTATALAIGEAQRDLATLAAVGARTRTRTVLAAAQAALLALAGTVIGLLVGAVPGVLWSLYATRRPVDPSVAESDTLWHTDLVIPWAGLGGAMVAIPLLAAAVAAVLVRGRANPTRRPG